MLTSVTKKYFQKFVEIILKGILHVLRYSFTFTCVWHASFWTNFLRHLWITCKKIIKIYICMCVILELLDKFIGSLTSCTQSEQIYHATRELHASTEQICWATRKLHASTWSDALMKCTTHEEHAYYIMCKIHAWLQHLWIRLQLTYRVVYSHCWLLC